LGYITKVTDLKDSLLKQPIEFLLARSIVLQVDLDIGKTCEYWVLAWTAALSFWWCSSFRLGLRCGYINLNSIEISGFRVDLRRFLGP
jgi:hypothetical protein